MSDEVYSHGHHPSVTAAHAIRTVATSAAYLEPLLETGMDLLDVGCGPGSITAGFAGIVAPGSVLGVDSSADVLAQAADEHADVLNVEFREGNVYDLDAADESFDVVHAHQVLQHLADPVAALREMRRVVRPGGLVAVREADFGAMTWFPAIEELDAWRDLYGRLARGNRGEPDAGRRLPGWAAAAGFTDVEVSSSNWTYASGEDRRFLADSWAERVLHSAFATQTLERGLADQRTLERLAEGWNRWARRDDGIFLMPSVEILARN
ncbi:methyltransferase domain-containing protein [Arthrobacter agilis]|uniref:methyltransferase domain-containing protein n=1 Tax=Arthrobacter agilis TaxID=37921 RepID=UPI0023663C6B|nr:methyltransferase domain-containing protein [Arthrobacter agilis]WDF32970.1 methyltransferase domain-containing protein [Arthrobacter agilis]